MLKVQDNQKVVFEDSKVSEVEWIRLDKLYQNIQNSLVEQANRSGGVDLVKIV